MVVAGFFAFGGLVALALSMVFDFGTEAPGPTFRMATLLSGVFCLCLAALIFPGLALMKQRRAGKTLYAVTDKGARINQTLYIISSDLPLDLKPKGPNSQVYLGSPRTTDQRDPSTGEMREVTIFPPSFRLLTEAEAEAAYKALKSLQSQSSLS